MIGNRIKEALRTRNRSVAQLADFLGITEQSVYRYLRDEVEPSVKQIMKISEFTGRSYLYFLAAPGSPAGGLPTLVVSSEGATVLELPILRGSSVTMTIE